MGCFCVLSKDCLSSYPHCGSLAWACQLTRVSLILGFGDWLTAAHRQLWFAAELLLITLLITEEAKPEAPWFCVEVAGCELLNQYLGSSALVQWCFEGRQVG